MKKWVFSTTFCLILGLGLFSGSAEAFDDLEPDWYADYKTEVYTLFHLGVVSGYPDGSFDPEGLLTREQFVKLLVSAAGLEATGPVDPGFADVGPDRWSSAWIGAAEAAGWLDVEKGAFEPARPITREEMAFMLDKALGVDGGPVSETVFSDEDRMAHPEAVRRIARAGLLRGFPDGTFRPDASARRIEAAIVIHRFLRSRRNLEVSAFYAIDSYGQEQERRRFDAVYYGWARLERNAAGEYEASTDGESVFRVPSGHEALFDPPVPAGACHLMVYADPAGGLLELLDGETEAFEGSVVQIVETFGFDGVCLDFEGLRDREGRKEAYARLVGRLRDRLDGRPVFVAVHPSNVAGHYDGYDYKALSESARALILMAYDYHHPDAPSFTAPAGKVREAVEAVLAAGVGPDRLILGLQAAGGVQWRSDGGAMSFYRPDSFSIDKALRLREGIEAFDYTAMTGTFRYEDGGASNLIFYENAGSIGFKMDLAAFYKLRGVSFWRLGLLTDPILDLVE